MRMQVLPNMRLSNKAKAGSPVGLIAAILAVNILWGPAGIAQAGESIPVEWDGPTTNLAWDGQSYATATGSIVGDVVAVPGDRAKRTAIVQNAGPSTACVTVQIYRVTSTHTTHTLNDDLESLIHLFWDINGHQGDLTWLQAREGADPNGIAYTVSFHLSRGEKFALTAGYYFPASATAGKNGGAPSTVLSFDVRILMQGDDHVKVPTGGTAISSPSDALLAVSLVMAGIGCLIAARLCRRASVAQR